MIKQLEIKEEIVLTEVTAHTDPEVVSYLYAQLKKVEESATDTRCRLNEPAIMNLNMPEDHVRAWVMVSDILTVVRHAQYRLADEHPYASVNNFLFGEIQKRVEETNRFIEGSVVLNIYREVPTDNLQHILTEFEYGKFANEQGIKKINEEIATTQAKIDRLYDQVATEEGECDKSTHNKSLAVIRIGELAITLNTLKALTEKIGIATEDETKNPDVVFNTFINHINQSIDEVNAIIKGVEPTLFM